MPRTSEQESRWNRLDETNRRSTLPLTLILVGAVGFTLWAASIGAAGVVEPNNNPQSSSSEGRVQQSKVEEQNFCGSWSWVFDQKAEICMANEDESVCGVPSGSRSMWSVHKKVPEAVGFRNITIYCDSAVSIYKP